MPEMALLRPVGTVVEGVDQVEPPSVVNLYSMVQPWFTPPVAPAERPTS